MGQTDFLSPSNISLDESKVQSITISEFFMNCGFDIGIIVFSLIVWKYLWLRIDKLKIRVIKDGTDYLMGREANLFAILSHIRAIIKQLIGLEENYIITKCGFEYYTYLFFLRRVSLLMAILIITDLCVWIPYQLFFLWDQFSLITMSSQNTNDFRTFYTIWVSFIILYGLHDMKKYLIAQLKYRNYRNNPKALLNNLKAKTLHMQFFDGHFIDEASIKAQMQQYLVQDMKQEDRILAVQAIPSYSQLLEAQYRIKITKIISEYGVNNLSWIWKFFKEETQQSLQQKHKELLKGIREKIQQTYKTKNIISCMIVVSHIETAERLCHEFEIGKALCNICPDIGYASEDAMWKVAGSKMIVRWAQQPKDIIWINMSLHSKQIFNFILFNILCVILLIASFIVIILATNDTYIKMPKLIGPFIVLIVNITLRFLITKMVEWENKTLRSDWQIKQYKMTIIYFIINVILGSILRDTLNIMTLLSTGWGWIELFSLIYKQADGYFYYIFILNQAAVAFFSTLVKPGQLFLDCYQAGLWYDKVTQVKRKALYGKNDSFRLGYAYSLAFIILAIVIIYSVSCPLIHFCGLAYFASRLYLDTYTLAVYHEDQLSSNLRLIEKVIQTISMMIAFWVFLVATTMVFAGSNSNSIILYIFCGIVIYFAATVFDSLSLKDPKTDEILSNRDIRGVIEEWKKEYSHPFNATQYEIQLDAYSGRKQRLHESMRKRQ